ncbi:ABC transporter substrate-binding protein [Aneurinibacillus sp. Ricciae_BoGa-3]|uniref:ABC transporter substrate-binding protein n=1 Tax=Aneurinibacillus sp. Ricciae_BoGa-3 TaxID=3022697 RepID=UPI0023411C88|nr:ABC transporter substrate-binding protein [Aneurinibacillus sp. Ricciae_BoGa-3]WCK53514.1 ABC transporter substrate-binding protein [Aneurinibacillus sp. Ricciae_BoGa-3]
MRRVMATGIALSLLVMGAAGCSTAAGTAKDAASPAASNAQSSAKTEKQVKVGVTQLVDHPALNSIRQGIVDELAAQGYKDKANMVLDYQNAQGDMSTVTTIAQQMATNKDDIIIPITTPSAQAVVNQAKGIPVVFSAVTDPVAAKLVPSLDKPSQYVTGTSDVSPMDKQVELIAQFLPKVKTIGVIYNTGEVNSGVQVSMVEKAAKAKGIAVQRIGITSSNEVKQGAEAAMNKVDTILVPVDNTVVSSFEALLTAAKASKKPLFASDSDTVKRGAIATYGIDYYKMGRQTGAMAVKVLKGAKPGSLPVETTKDTQLVINKKAVQSFGLKIPDALKSKAKFLD